MPLRESEETIFVVGIISLNISTRTDDGHYCSVLLVLCRSDGPRRGREEGLRGGVFAAVQ